MSWLDWCIVVVPLLIVLMIGLKSQKYVKSVADFLAAGRVAGRYVICVASGEASYGLISLIAAWAWNLPVLDDEHKYLGFVSKSQIFSSYRDQLKAVSDE